MYAVWKECERASWGLSCGGDFIGNGEFHRTRRRRSEERSGCRREGFWQVSQLSNPKWRVIISLVGKNTRARMQNLTHLCRFMRLKSLKYAFVIFTARTNVEVWLHSSKFLHVFELFSRFSTFKRKNRAEKWQKNIFVGNFSRGNEEENIKPIFRDENLQNFFFKIFNLKKKNRIEKWQKIFLTAILRDNNFLRFFWWIPFWKV